MFHAASTHSNTQTSWKALERWVIGLSTGGSVDEECLEHLEPHLKPWINNYKHHGWLDDQDSTAPPPDEPILIPAILLPTSH
ncbi:hypothetical protein PENSUB_4963 [Penicillium subrubescens]|uniref:Uncharacterized protein n=1 Tax=Penicillium subrubescens TaxID=1316194 RepID=A0A1Q5UB40_9EURO|nr:hypothetical protein PENSUB_4963 [Penicillium subrubescens]